MRSTWIVTGVMLVLVAALGLFAYLKPPARDAARQALSTLRPAEVTKLRVARRGKLVIEAERRGEQWVLTAPYAAPLDVFQIARAVTILEAKNTAHYPASGLAKYELDPPVAEVTINGQTFAFGAINPVTREQYVLAGNAVHAVEMRHGAGLPTDASALLRKQLFAADEVPVRFGFNDFSVASENGKWSLTPAAGELSQDDYNRWSDAWRHATALRVEPYDQRKPQGEIHIELKDKPKLTLGILSRSPELVLLRPDLKLQFTFVAEVGKRMLEPPVVK
jgi:hypothetical protein